MPHIDAENTCVYCGRDTAFGSGRFVNRIPASIVVDQFTLWAAQYFPAGTQLDGYACADCLEPDEEDLCQCATCHGECGGLRGYADTRDPDSCELCDTGECPMSVFLN